MGPLNPHVSLLRADPCTYGIRPQFIIPYHHEENDRQPDRLILLVHPWSEFPELSGVLQTR